jgi:hypothetical protein
MEPAWLDASCLVVLTKFGLMTTYYLPFIFGWSCLSMDLRAV